MGVYWVVVNDNSKQMLNPHNCGDGGAKLYELSRTGRFAEAFFYLLGGGFGVRAQGKFFGRWIGGGAGDGQSIRLLNDASSDLEGIEDKYEDISLKVLEEIDALKIPMEKREKK